jgi:hypothetical protein
MKKFDRKPQMSSNPNTTGLVDLPADLLEKVADFLLVGDAFRLSRTSKAVYSLFPLSMLESLLMKRTRMVGKSVGEPRCHRGPKIPVFLPIRTHTIVIQCKWRDQGWGNRKAKFLIVAHKKSNNHTDDNVDNINNGRVVVQSPIAEHSETLMTLSFSPSRTTAEIEEEVYHLWYEIGGGGGHQLHITSDVKMFSVVFDSEQKSAFKAYHRLRELVPTLLEQCRSSEMEQTPQRFWLGLLQAAIESLLGQRRRKELLDPSLSGFLQSHGFEVDDEASLLALQDLVNSVVQAKWMR